jgi:hypothetical protein
MRHPMRNNFKQMWGCMLVRVRNFIIDSYCNFSHNVKTLGTLPCAPIPIYRLLLSLPHLPLSLILHQKLQIPIYNECSCMYCSFWYCYCPRNCTHTLPRNTPYPRSLQIIILKPVSRVWWGRYKCWFPPHYLGDAVTDAHVTNKMVVQDIGDEWAR